MNTRKKVGKFRWPRLLASRVEADSAEEQGVMTPESFPFHRTHLHAPGAGRKSAGVPLGVGLGVVLLGMLAAGTAALGAWHTFFPDQPKQEKNLLSQQTFSNLKTDDVAPPEPPAVPPVVEPQPSVPVVQGEPPRVIKPVVEQPQVPDIAVPSIETPVVVPPFKVPEVAAPTLLAPPPSLLEVPPPVVAAPAPAAVPLAAPPVLEEPREPLVFAHHNLSLLGDSPMIRTWKLVGVTAVIATSLAVPLPVAAQQEDNTKAILKRLDELEKSLEKSFKNVLDDIKLLQKDSEAHLVDLGKANLKIEQLESQLAKLRKDVESLKTRPSDVPTTPILDKIALDDLKNKLGQIEQALYKLQPERISLSPPAVGRVLLVNYYPEELLFIINQKTHRVGPGMTVAVDSLPAGNMTYEVISPSWGVRARKTTSLGANETFTLSVR